MGSAGLLLVGVVLLVNGLVILGQVTPRSAGLLNIFVGAVQVVLPTIILAQHAADPAVVNATWPTYLFGITYLYYGIGIYADAEPEGLGWFSLFVAGVVGYLAVTTLGEDPLYAVLLLTWTIMWSLFFLLMALGLTRLERFTGWFLVLFGVPSCTVSAIALLNGQWSTDAAVAWAALAVLAGGSLLAAFLAGSGLARAAQGSTGAGSGAAAGAGVAPA